MVIDTDGSAFITKAEFDSLKNSFQAQIDNYNSSIDSKIDGAISSYLAGVNINKTSIQNTIPGECDVTCLDENQDDITGEYCWKEGVLGWNLRSGDKAAKYNNKGTAQWSNRTTAYNGTLSWTATDKFTERKITNLNTARNNAQWGGIVTNKVTLRNDELTQFSGIMFGFADVGHSNSGKASYTRIGYTGYLPCNVNCGWIKLSNCIWDGVTYRAILREGGAFASKSQQSSMTDDYPDEITSSLSYWSAGQPIWSIADLKAERTEQSTRLKNIIIFSDSLPGSRFTNFDAVTDFCNDPISTGHTREIWIQNMINYKIEWVATLSKWLTGGGGGNIYYGKADTGYLVDAQGYNDSTHIGGTYWEKASDPGSLTQWCRPYVGFVTTITDWNQLWTDEYDSYTSEFESNISVHKDNSNITHLALCAGLPLVKYHAGERFKIPIKFNDSTDHIIYFSYDGFTTGTVSDSTTIDVNEIEVVNGTKDIVNNGIIVASGETATVTLPKTSDEGFIWCKWSLSSQPKKGGGEFHVPSEITVITD